MQSSLFSNYQPLQEAKISQLNLKVKKWKLFSIIFVIIAFTLSTTLVLTIFTKQSKSVNPLQQSIKSSQACTNFQFNNTNLTEFRWRIKYNTTNQNQQFSASQLTKVLSLNLSSNLLNQFSYNSLPDLLQLKLFTKRVFQNYYIETVSNNNFPKLQNFSVPRVKTFSNNHLPSLVNFQQDNFFFLNFFDNNYMPTLNGSRNFFGPNSLTGNTMGLQQLRFDVGDSGFQFYNNTLPELKSFQIYCWNYVDQIPTSKIMNNNFPNLQNFALYCNIVDFKQSNKLKKLKRFYLRSSSIKQLTNGSYPQLLEFHTQAQNLESFTYNNLPLLQNLQLSGEKIINVCEGNYMPNLKRVQYRSVDLKNIECLRNASKLQSLSLTFVVAPVQNFNLPKLKYLNILLTNNPMFRNNSFPSIEGAYIYHVNTFTSFKSANITFGSKLTNLSITDSNLQELSFDKEMPNLTRLGIMSSNLSSLNCTNFRNVKEIVLSKNKLKDDVVDALINCNLTNPTYLYLEDNLIADKTKARSKLSSKYPNLYISL